MLIEGKVGIQAECLKKTKGHLSDIATLRVRFPRFVAEQFLKHRMFSCNAVSSRAMSVPKMNKWVEDHPAEPLFWGAQKKGMQPNSELDKNEREACIIAWETAKTFAMKSTSIMWKMGAHQQIPNRLTHPFQMSEYIVTATDWDNFFNLRLYDKAAQSEINELARCMHECLEKSELELPIRGWHLPYVLDSEAEFYHIEDLRVLSASRCCVISYNNHDTDERMDLVQAKRLFKHLVSDTNPHYTPLEHQARDLNIYERTDIKSAQQRSGFSKRKQKQMEYFANFHGWVSHRYESEGL